MKYNLSEITALIKDRRTISPDTFSDRKVHKEQIELLLNNAIWAPTHGMTQPWRFKVFMEEGKVKLSDFLSDLYLKTTPEDKVMTKKLEKIKNRTNKASAIIAICMERQVSEKIPEIEEIAAVACAVQNMHLTCTAYGLGGFWSSPKMVYSDEMKNFLDIGPEDLCLGLFYVGYPGEEWPKGQRKPIEYVTEWIQK
ncbi:nitroreductase family protein [Brumimicrobium aurantiacum]|uniref:Putative NAD(P)H nitroreductase n=1 Tax=Brumimicrobium aurantiacum TaxID=1737063 RepID=A0A3E1EXK4_9FLAO|nr:nitroreductase [Brumimicrobium aurantiacum]RFC54290.1 nitroreductase [Brumimicrobium aurantiacum]